MVEILTHCFIFHMNCSAKVPKLFLWFHWIVYFSLIFRKLMLRKAFRNIIIPLNFCKSRNHYKTNKDQTFIRSSLYQILGTFNINLKPISAIGSLIKRDRKFDVLWHSQMLFTESKQWINLHPENLNSPTFSTYSYGILSLLVD